jgi:hypothetical protein
LGVKVCWKLKKGEYNKVYWGLNNTTYRKGITNKPQDVVFSYKDSFGSSAKEKAPRHWRVKGLCASL